MEIARDISSARELLHAGGIPRAPIALVPTMGALHAGHLSLIKLAKKISHAGKGCKVVVTIFVNKRQFDKERDFASYPQLHERDIDLCRKTGADLVFIPSHEEIYAEDFSTTVAENCLSRTMEGANRPGHFSAVCTIVCKLFNIFLPQHAIFGRKDFQQLAIIKKMVADLNFPISIHPAETVRAKDGLALSSRNSRLSSEERRQAPQIYQSLLLARELFKQNKTPSEINQQVENFLTSKINFPNQKKISIDYVKIFDENTLEILNDENLVNKKDNAVLATAVNFPSVRLIDNIKL